MKLITVLSAAAIFSTRLAQARLSKKAATAHDSQRRDLHLEDAHAYDRPKCVIIDLRPRSLVFLLPVPHSSCVFLQCTPRTLWRRPRLFVAPSKGGFFVSRRSGSFVFYPPGSDEPVLRCRSFIPSSPGSDEPILRIDEHELPPAQDFSTYYEPLSVSDVAAPSNLRHSHPSPNLEQCQDGTSVGAAPGHL
jgi:hypothetical protein